jgi:hypothetical protein
MYALYSIAAWTLVSYEEDPKWHCSWKEVPSQAIESIILTALPPCELVLLDLERQIGIKKSSFGYLFSSYPVWSSVRPKLNCVQAEIDDLEQRIDREHALFNSRLAELELQYARELRHMNPPSTTADWNMFEQWRSLCSQL